MSTGGARRLLLISPPPFAWQSRTATAHSRLGKADGSEPVALTASVPGTYSHQLAPDACRKAVECKTKAQLLAVRPD